MKKINVKKALASVAALSVVACMAAIPASAAEHTFATSSKQAAVVIEDVTVTLDELDAICTRAVMHGYTVAWDADMSEIYFAHNNHLAVFAPGENIRGAKKIEKYYTESPIDADIRQAMWNDFTTSDDHLMHITGIAKDQNGVKYYIVKNSWGPDNGDGYLYVSESYFKAKTIQIMVAKDALTKGIKKKLDIK